MPIENATYISDLNVSNPAATDQLADADNHLRLIKQVLKSTFPNLTGPVVASQNDLRGLVPVGCILPFVFEASKVPTGWALCDGSTVTLSDGSGTIQTPDLRDRHIVGVSVTKTLRQTLGADSQTVTSTNSGSHTHTGTTGGGGAHNHGGNTGNTTLTIQQIPSHQHQVGAAKVASRYTPVGMVGESNTAVANEAFGTDFTGGGEAHRHTISSEANHTHSFTAPAAGDHNHSVTVPTVPKAVALNYIMKI